jgi:hypothetical protein
MRLKKEQRNALQEWVASGLKTDEINLKAAEFEPPFSVSRALADYYRKTRNVKIGELMQSGDYDALKTGLALKAERVNKLAQLAGLMELDLFGDVLWVSDVKMIGSGAYQERVEFDTFNAAEVQQYRGVLDDIAKEVGDRAQRNEVTGKDGGKIEQEVTVLDGTILRKLLPELTAGNAEGKTGGAE